MFAQSFFMLLIDKQNNIYLITGLTFFEENMFQLLLFSICFIQLFILFTFKEKYFDNVDEIGILKEDIGSLKEKLNHNKLHRENKELHKKIYNFGNKINQLNSELLLIKQEKEKSTERYQQNNLRDHDNQLRFIEEGNLKKTKLMNTPEYYLFLCLSDIIRDIPVKKYLYAQVCMGSFLAQRQDRWLDSQAYSSINSKRCDFVITDNFGEVILVVEYNGTGHMGDDEEQTQKRDLVKAKALESTNIPLIVVTFDEFEGTRNEKLPSSIKDNIIKIIG